MMWFKEQKKKASNEKNLLFVGKENVIVLLNAWIQAPKRSEFKSYSYFLAVTWLGDNYL
jgi:hypothetical protein